MKPVELKCILFLFLAVELHSQGFDWQYSARLPFDTPVFFMGITAGADFSYSFSYLPLLEKGYRPCCDFDRGIGYSGSIGLNFERWFTDYSIFSKLMFGYFRTDFDENGIPYPMRYNGTLISEYNYTTYIRQLIIEPGIRYRLFNTNFCLSGSVRTAVVISDSYVISDSKVRHYDAKIPDLNRLYLQLNLGVGYDFSTGLGKYSTIGVQAGIPVTGLTGKESWYPLNLGMFINYNSGL